MPDITPENSISPLQLFWETMKRLVADEAIPLAGNIAFRMMFSAFPFLIFLTAIAGFVGSEEWVEHTVQLLLSVAPNNVVEPLAREVRSILTVPRVDLLSIGALLTIWTLLCRRTGTAPRPSPWIALPIWFKPSICRTR